jgi:hypothetical protein
VFLIDTLMQFVAGTVIVGVRGRQHGVVLGMRARLFRGRGLRLCPAGLLAKLVAFVIDILCRQDGILFGFGRRLFRSHDQTSGRVGRMVNAMAG